MFLFCFIRHNNKKEQEEETKQIHKYTVNRIIVWSSATAFASLLD